jgi:hypothetical protein
MRDSHFATGVDAAIDAWKLVLAGRFRLLHQWCNFVRVSDLHLCCSHDLDPAQPFGPIAGSLFYVDERGWTWFELV